MKFTKYCCWIVVLCICAAPVWAATKTWDQAGGVQWGTSTSWNPDGVPASTDTCILDLANGLCEVWVNNTNTGGETYVGNNTGPMTLKLRGTLNLSTSYNLYLGNAAAANGTLHMEGGMLTCKQLHVGGYGRGTLIMNGGRIDASTVYVAGQTGSYGTIYLNAGTINIIYDLRMNNWGVGTPKLVITGGKLVYNGDKRTNINTYIANGWVTAGNYGHIVVDYNNLEAGKTVVYASTLANCLKPPTTLYYIYYADISDDEWITLSNLQGLLARYTNENIFFYKVGVTDLWLNDMVSRYGISAVDVRALRGTQTSFQWAMNYFRPYIFGYGLYNQSTQVQSLDVATSLSPMWDGVAVSSALKPTVDALGFTQKKDYRSNTVSWMNTNFADRLAQNKIVVKEDNPAVSWTAMRLHELTSAFMMMYVWDSSTSLTGPIYDKLCPNSPCFGWADKAYSDELDAINYHSEKGLYQVPASGCANMAVYASMANRVPLITLTQNVPAPTSIAKVDNKHHVCIIYSDMDNLSQTTSQGWATDPTRFGNSHRGQFCMGWGMPPSMVELSPNIVKWYYDNGVANKDNFVFPFSGTGYFDPSKFDATEITAHVGQLNKLMGAMDVHTGVIYDRYNAVAGGKQSYFAGMSNARGFFVAGEPYNYHGKNITWSGGKPFISIRDLLWTGFDSASSLASKINSRSTNASTEDAYTVVMLHAWSYGTDEAYNLTTLLNSNVRVVTPEELVEQVRLHNVP